MFPTRCPYCTSVMSKDDPACKKCLPKLPEIVYNRFAIGGIPCVAPLPYLNEYADAVKRFKFGGKAGYAHAFAVTMAQTVRESYDVEKFDCISCVPMYRKAKKRRSYNQAELLARECAEILGLPFDDLLEKFKDTPPQHTMKRSERGKNVKGVFRVRDKSLVRGRNILLIDDIITTGNTLGECARMLKRGGCRDISCAVVCTAVVI